MENDKMIRSGAAEYLTYIATIGDREDNIEVRYEEVQLFGNSE